eukprot:Sspe_Gene.18527::Locus_6657_Transcript_1_1_Confidence_1.000_Length_1724::g.18527::m.18527
MLRESFHELVKAHLLCGDHLAVREEPDSSAENQNPEDDPDNHPNIRTVFVFSSRSLLCGSGRGDSRGDFALAEEGNLCFPVVIVLLPPSPWDPGAVRVDDCSSGIQVHTLRDRTVVGVVGVEEPCKGGVGPLAICCGPLNHQVVFPLAFRRQGGICFGGLQRTAPPVECHRLSGRRVDTHGHYVCIAHRSAQPDPPPFAPPDHEGDPDDLVATQSPDAPPHLHRTPQGHLRLIATLGVRRGGSCVPGALLPNEQFLDSSFRRAVRVRGSGVAKGPQKALALVDNVGGGEEEDHLNLARAKHSAREHLQLVILLGVPTLLADTLLHRGTAALLVVSHNSHVRLAGLHLEPHSHPPPKTLDHEGHLDILCASLLHETPIEHKVVVEGSPVRWTHLNQGDRGRGSWNRCRGTPRRGRCVRDRGGDGHNRRTSGGKGRQRGAWSLRDGGGKRRAWG